LVGKSKLPRSASLKRRVEIDSLFGKGQRFPTDFFTLIWQPAEQFRYGIFVSKSVRTAVARNRLKRRFREAVRLSRHNLAVSGHVAVLPRVVRTEPALERLIDDFSRIFQQLSRTH
jgi:ribonuclease P protein component